MEIEEKDIQEVQETPEGEAEPEVAEEVEEEDVEEEKVDVDDLKKKADASSKNFERAKKAEAEVKALKESKKGEVPEGEDLSTNDIIYLAKADIHEDDIEEVREWAKFKGVSVSEAHKQLKGNLDTKAEERKTAEASTTGRGSRKPAKNTGDDLLAKAEKSGEVPDTEEGMDSLAEARMAKRKAALKK